MEGVEFNEEQNLGGGDPFEKREMSPFVRLVMNIGLAKNEKQANTVLLIVAVLFFALALYFFFS